MALAAQKPRRALAGLETGLASARNIRDQEGVLALTRHAAVICSHLGDPKRAVGFYEEAQSIDSDDPYLCLAVGRLRLEMNQPEEARLAFAAALGLGQKRSDTEVIQVATELLRQ
jgi:hypothetical protein